MWKLVRAIKNPYDLSPHLTPINKGRNMPKETPSYFHLHLVSDATGETLMNVGRAASVQFPQVSPIEHIYPLVRNAEQLERVLSDIEKNPGIVLYTLVNPQLIALITEKCKEFGCPALSVLEPVHQLFAAYLGAQSTPRVGAQHLLNAEYYRRIDALNFTMMHDDGLSLETIGEADVVLLGISRTSKTPTSIYMANRGVKTANIPLVPALNLQLPIEALQKTFCVGLIATPERIGQIRQNRVLSLKSEKSSDSYIDQSKIIEELTFSKRLFSRYNWPVIDVTRRSIEETAASIISLWQAHKQRKLDA
jgi:[pyruvate, water dikinase]-phosphate phosphotransferase / [pyruvate, water dikinase] kinase